MNNLQLWAEISVAISTFLAVLIALFGDVLKAKLFSPKFTISLKNKAGELNKTNGGISTRYYHLVIGNKRTTIANDCIVSLVKIESVGNVGTSCYWEGDVPLTWIYPTVYKTIYKNIGSSEECDLIKITEEKEVFFETLFDPNNFPSIFKERFTLLIGVKVKSVQATSEVIRFKLEWDGLWEPGEAEMQRHFSIIQL